VEPFVESHHNYLLARAFVYDINQTTQHYSLPSTKNIHKEDSSFEFFANPPSSTNSNLSSNDFQHLSLYLYPPYSQSINQSIIHTDKSNNHHHNVFRYGLVPRFLPRLWQANRWQCVLLRSMPSRRVWESFLERQLSTFFTILTSRDFLAYQVKWLLHGTSIQLQQRTTIRHNLLISNLLLLPTIEITINTSSEAYLNPFEFTIQSLLNAEHNLINLLGTSTIIGRIEEGIKGICQLIWSLAILKKAIWQPLNEYSYLSATNFFSTNIISTSAFIGAISDTKFSHHDTNTHTSLKIVTRNRRYLTNLPSNWLLYKSAFIWESDHTLQFTSSIVGIQKFPWVIITTLHRSIQNSEAWSLTPCYRHYTFFLIHPIFDITSWAYQAGMGRNQISESHLLWEALGPRE